MTQAIEEFKGIVEKNGSLNYKHRFFEGKCMEQFPIREIMKL
jgi:hypothetical protein